jgi:Fic family protein
MTIELDSTLAQAEVLFLSFAQLVADIDKRRAEEASHSNGVLRRRGITTSGEKASLSNVSMPTLSKNLRDLLKAGR